MEGGRTSHSDSMIGAVHAGIYTCTRGHVSPFLHNNTKGHTCTGIGVVGSSTECAGVSAGLDCVWHGGGMRGADC